MSVIQYEYVVKLLVVFAALVVGPDVVVGNDVPVTDRSVNKKVPFHSYGIIHE